MAFRYFLWLTIGGKIYLSLNGTAQKIFNLREKWKMRKKIHWIIEEEKCRNDMLDCIWWQKAIRIANRAMNAQNLTFIKTQSFVTSSHSSPHIFAKQQFEQWKLLLIFHVAQFQIIFNIGRNLLFNVGGKKPSKTQKCFLIKCLTLLSYTS